jgi:hypothetical protein
MLGQLMLKTFLAIASGTKPTISIELEVSFVNEKSSSVAIIKTQPDAVFDGGKDFVGQLQVIKLNGSPFDSLHAFLHHSLNPFFRSFMKAGGKKSDKDPKGVVEKKMAELELTLYNCKQNVQIEQVKLSFHPDIAQAAKKVQARPSSTRLATPSFVLAAAAFAHAVHRVGRRPYASGRGLGRARHGDPLPQLAPGHGERVDSQHPEGHQARTVPHRHRHHVVARSHPRNRHFRIETMPAGSETLQEIKFWVELEGVLQNITDQLETPESRTFTHPTFEARMA